MTIDADKTPKEPKKMAKKDEATKERSRAAKNRLKPNNYSGSCNSDICSFVCWNVIGLSGRYLEIKTNIVERLHAGVNFLSEAWQKNQMTR